MITTITNAIAAKRAQLGKDEKGFTLIELLVVVLIIGILSAIAIPVFIGQQDQAKDAAAKSDLANAKVAAISYVTANGTAPSTADHLEEFGYVQSTPAAIEVIDGTADGLCLKAVSATSKAFYITNSTGASTTVCS